MVLDGGEVVADPFDWVVGFVCAFDYVGLVLVSATAVVALAGESGQGLGGAAFD
jgi:hypothetical protein